MKLQMYLENFYSLCSLQKHCSKEAITLKNGGEGVLYLSKVLKCFSIKDIFFIRTLSQNSSLLKQQAICNFTVPTACRHFFSLKWSLIWSYLPSEINTDLLSYRGKNLNHKNKQLKGILICLCCCAILNYLKLPQSSN